jgi:protein SCO1/2
MSKTSLAWLAIAFLVGGGFMVFIASRNLSQRMQWGATSNPIVWPPEAPPDSASKWMKSFSLVERTGKTVSSEDLKGKPYVASFFFSSCPGTCVRQNELVAGMVTEFKNTDVRFLSISTDPKSDTPAALRAYALKMRAPDDRWFFLTGDPTYIRRVAAEMFATSVSEDGKTHGSKMLLVDRDGNFVGAYAWEKNDELKRLKEAIRAVVAGEDVKAKGLTPLSTGEEAPHRVIDDEDEQEESNEADAKSSDAEPGESPPAAGGDSGILTK